MFIRPGSLAAYYEGCQEPQLQVEPEFKQPFPLDAYNKGSQSIAKIKGRTLLLPYFNGPDLNGK